MSTTTRHEHDGLDRGSNLFAQHHQYLERRFAYLRACAAGGDPVQLRTEWTRFEHELLGHLEIEDQQLLPAFERDNPAEAEAIRAEHAQIRKALLDLGVTLDLHLLRADAVEGFIRQLAEHALREEQVLYPWADRHISGRRWVALGHALLRAARGGSRMLLRELGHVM